MDLVMVSLFRSLIILGGKAEDFNSYGDKFEIFEFLTEYFSVEACVY